MEYCVEIVCLYICIYVYIYVQCIQPKEGTQLILATQYIFCCKKIILGAIASKVGVSVE